MTRISLREAYDNSSVIKQIADLTDKTEASTAISNEAIAKAVAAVTKASKAEVVADNAAATAGAVDGKVTVANETAAEAVAKAEEAGASARNAEQIAEAARIAANAVEAKATEALVTASAADRKATSAFDSAESASNAAAQAQQSADSVEAKTIVNKNRIVNVEGRVGSLETRQGQDEARMNVSVKNVVIKAGASDAKVEMTKQSGDKVETAVPIASASQTGMMNSQTFRNITDIDERVRTLETGYNVYWGTFPNNSPSQEQIQATYEAAGGPMPTPIGATVADAKKKLSYVWVGDSWVKPDVASIPAFGQGTSGLIKGGDPSIDGVVVAEPGGTGSVQGWDALKARVTNLEASEGTIDGQIADLTKRTSAVESKAIANEATIEAVGGQANTNAGEISKLKTAVGDSTKGLVKQVADIDAVAEGAASTASAAKVTATDAQTKANASITTVKGTQKVDKVELGLTKNDGSTATVDIGAVNATNAGVVKAEDWKHVTSDNAAETITANWTFKTSPMVPNLTPQEEATQRIMPSSQIVAKIAETDDAIAGVQAKVDANDKALGAVAADVAAIGVTASIVQGSAPGKNAISVTVNGKTSKTEDLPSGSAWTEITSPYNLDTVPDDAIIMVKLKNTVEPLGQSGGFNAPINAQPVLRSNTERRTYGVKEGGEIHARFMGRIDANMNVLCFIDLRVVSESGAYLSVNFVNGYEIKYVVLSSEISNSLKDGLKIYYK